MLDGEAATAGQGKAKAPVAAPDRSLGLTSRFGGWLSGATRPYSVSAKLGPSMAICGYTLL